MSQIDVRQQLQERFSKPVESPQKRRIVIWHDAAGEFEEDFLSIADEGLVDSESNPIECIFVADGNTFETKRRLLRLEADRSFLLYRQCLRGIIGGDWFADVELYAEHFQSDYQSMLIDEIGAKDSDEIRRALQQFAAFFKAKDRVAKFSHVIPKATTREDIAMGVFATLCKSDNATVESILYAFGNELAQSLGDEGVPNIVEILEKYDAASVFRGFVQQKIGYEGELSDARSFLCHLLLTAAASVMPSEALGGLERFISPAQSEFALSVVREWMKETEPSKTSSLYEAAEMVQEECNLTQRFEDEKYSYLVECDIFPCIDKCLLRSFMKSISTGSDRSEETIALVSTRKNLYWYDLTKCYYDCLLASAKLQAFYRTHAQGFHISLAKDVWKGYVQDWWEMDAAYREFCNAYIVSKRDISSVDDATDDLADWADSLYTEWFLTGINECWVNAAQQQWAELGYIDGIPRQRNFYADEVHPKSGQGKRIVIGISDGMRYEVACSLSERLQRETKGQCKVTSMQSIFPSETKFGMAALLPHKDLTLTDFDGNVLVDGKPTVSTADREALLQEGRPDSKAILFSDLVNMRSAERKEFAGDAPVIYVYQNTIDKAGHAEHAGQDVFDACEQAITDMKTLVDISTKDLGAQNVLITADHGFLFTRQDLTELDLSSKTQVDGNVLKAERRFLTAKPGATSSIFIEMNMEDLDGGSFTWLVARGCQRIKVPGSKNYVHGGISLQECCVPVVHFKNMRSNSKGYVGTQAAVIQLLSTSRKVSNTLFNLEFFQKDAVGGKVLPAEYELVFTDGSGNEVSDTRKVLADMTFTNEQDRVARVKFTLKSGMSWDSKAIYYLVCREKATNKIVWKEEFQIEVAFAPVDDFGW